MVDCINTRIERCLICSRRASPAVLLVASSRGALCDFCLRVFNQSLLEQQGILRSKATILADEMAKHGSEARQANLLAALAKGVPALAGLSADTLFEALAEPQSDLVMEASDFELDFDVVSVLPFDLLEQYLAVPLYAVEGVVIVVVPDHLRAYGIHGDLRDRGEFPAIKLVQASRSFCEQAFSVIFAKRHHQLTDRNSGDAQGEGPAAR